MLFSPVFVSVDENNTVIFSASGETAQYVEVEPGLLVSKEHPDQKIVLKEENGQVSLHPSSPSVFIKTPWYATMGINLLIFIGGMLFFLFTLIGWIISFFSSLFKHEARPFLARLARLVGGLFWLTFLVFLLLLFAVMVDVDPAYGVPNLFFETPAWLGNVMQLPILIGLLGLSMLPFAILAWIKRFWTFGGRLFYSFLTLFAGAILWAFIYWNLLL